MKLDLLREMLKRHEGLRLKPYRDSRGFWTIGYGWNLKNPLPSDVASMMNLTGGISEDFADRLLTISICTANCQCLDLFEHFQDFSERRQAALADFVFNVGIGTALKFKKAMQAIKAGDWNEAADEMRDSEWFSQVGLRGSEIVGMIREG